MTKKGYDGFPSQEARDYAVNSILEAEDERILNEVKRSSRSAGMTFRFARRVMCWFLGHDWRDDEIDPFEAPPHCIVCGERGRDRY